MNLNKIHKKYFGHYHYNDQGPPVLMYVATIID